MTEKMLLSLTQLEMGRLREYIKFVYTAEFGEKKIAFVEILKLFINFMEVSVHEKWIENDLLAPRDFRRAAFIRIEIAIATYYHSVKMSQERFGEIVNDSMNLGYSFEFSLALAGGEREVQLRTSFLDRYFYTIDHFIQCMEREFHFATATNTKRKQQIFSEMLKHFGLNDKFVTPSGIFNLISLGRNDSNSDWIETMRNTSARKIMYSDLYEYVANIRNSLHNNGFSNKSMNDLTIGELKYEMKKGEFLRCLSLSHLIALLIPITKVLEEVVTCAAAMRPDVLLDPFSEEIRNHLKK